MEPSTLAAAAAEPAPANGFSNADFDEASDRRPGSHPGRIRAAGSQHNIETKGKGKPPAAQLHSTWATVSDIVTPLTLPHENAAIDASRGASPGRGRYRCEPTRECSTASHDAKLHSDAKLHPPTRAAASTLHSGMTSDGIVDADDRARDGGHARATRGSTECSTAPECSTAAPSCRVQSPSQARDGTR